MKIWVSPYTLRARKPLSSISTALDRTGALLKIESDAGVGYSDLHPWTELGDVPLGAQLEALSQGRPTELAQRSVALADADREARGRGESIFSGLNPPPLSHFLISDVRELTPGILIEIASQGFRTLKIKIGRDLERESTALTRLKSELSVFRIRLDANGKLNEKTFLMLVKVLPETVKQIIEFVEDPIPSLADNWQQLRALSPFPLAIDRCSIQDLSKFTSDWIVLKPANQTPGRILDWAKKNSARICVTSYLDHPVGQVGAAYVAAKIATSSPSLIGTCGLNSHSSFESNDFSEALSAHGPEFIAPMGTGIGFDELLSASEWKPLR